MSACGAARPVGATAVDHALLPVLTTVLGLVALGCIGGIFRAAAIVPLHVSLDPNDGWNAYHAAAAMAGHGLYPAPADLMVNNYPPLSFYLVGWIGTLVGDQIAAGRIVSLVSFLFACGCVAAIARALGTSRWAALLSGEFFAAVLLAASDYVGMDDPQLLGHAFQLSAAFLVLRERRTRAAVFAAALLFVAGGFVKHNLFVLPLASLLWLTLFDRRDGGRLAVWGSVIAFAGLIAFRAGFGFDLLERLNAARNWSFAKMWTDLAAWLPLAAVPLCGLGALIVRDRKDPYLAFVAIYAALAVVVGTVLLGGAGVDVNAMFDADIVLALVSGLAFDRLLVQRRSRRIIAAPAFAIACFLPLPLQAAGDDGWRDPSFWTHPMHDERALAARDIAFLRARHGPAMCESLAWCYWAGKTAPVDVFNVDQQLRKKTRNPASLLALVGSRVFGAIELDETDPFPLPPQIEAAIRQSYRIDHSDDEGTFFVQR